MASSELKGIYIDTHNSHPFIVNSQGLDDRMSSSGISSGSGSITSNNNYSALPRKRNLSPDATDCDTQLDDYEMDKIRRLMVQMDGGGMPGTGIPSSHRGSIEPSLMSTVFAVVLVLIISISVYAFASLFRAVFKRMNP